MKAQDNVSATLIAHAGAQVVDRQQLALIPTPPPMGPRHHPIAHIELVERLEKILTKHKLRIEAEQFAVQTGEGMRLFGTLKLSYDVTEQRPGTQGYRFAIGIRTANNQSMSVQMVAGANVFVCDNMAFNGSLVTLNRKHTTGIDLQRELEGAVMRALSQFTHIRQSIDQMQATEISDDDAKVKIYDAAVIKGIMPLRLMPVVNKHYFTPPHQEFAPRTLWSLNNAFTEGFKELTPAVGMEAGVQLGKLMMAA